MEQIDSRFSQGSKWQTGSPKRWVVGAIAASGLALLASGGMYSASLTQQFGLFPTLFLGTVISGCVAMQLAELSEAHQPRH
jgi:hypothetical protein